MTKYIWIVMILALYIYWAYMTAKDTLRCVHYFRTFAVLEELNKCATAFYSLHISVIFIFSFMTFFELF